jgi:crotonobetainyl-CoA:carnitine CoA-transferase CaiB-like acyl-CoA transferase
LEAAIAVLAALQERHATGQGQHVDVAMAATILAVNERLHAQLCDIDAGGEPVALSAADSPIIDLPNGDRVTIAGSPVYTPIFQRYCAMMRRPDLLRDPRFQTPELRRAHEVELLAEVRAWIVGFRDLKDLESQVKVAGLAVGVLRSSRDFVESEWGRDRGAIVEIDDGAGGVIKAPAPPWRFSGGALDPPTWVARRGQHNHDVLGELGLSADDIRALEKEGVLSAEVTV